MNHLKNKIYTTKARAKNFSSKPLATAVAFALGVNFVQAATYTVTNTNDAGMGSLRQAVIDSNNSAGLDTIIFDTTLIGSTVNLSSGTNLESISGDLTISGPVAGDDSSITINAHLAPHVFRTAEDDTNLTVENMTLTGASLGAISIYMSPGLTLNDVIVSGNANATGIRSGGISCFQTSYITLNRSTISYNTGGQGGGIYASGCPNITLNQSTISNNTSTGRGGGIFAATANLFLNDSIISENSVSGRGGGLYSSNGEVTLNRTSVRDNSTSGEYSDGGGMFVFYGNTTLIKSTVSGNSTNGEQSDGGGMAILGGSTTLNQSTISGNLTSGNLSTGGGVDLHNASAIIQQSTITNNSSTSGAGGLHNYSVVGIYGPTATMSIYNSILANNSGAEDNIYKNDGGVTLNVTSSLFGDVASEINGTSTTNVFNNVPGLGPLQNNGGPTLTHVPGVGSPALDAGDNASIPDTVDQRGGFMRIQNSTVDIGSVERQTVIPPVTTLVLPDNTTSDATPTYIWNAVPNSSWYYLWVNDTTGNKIKQWYTAAAAGCSDGTGTCSITPTTPLANGVVNWWIQTWNSAGVGLWSTNKSFTVDDTSSPPSAKLLSPDGTLSDTTPTYTWHVVSDSTWYYLWVDDATGNKIKKWYTAADAGCANGMGTCSVKPTTILNAGNGQWWIRSWNQNGYGPWSAPNSFNVDLTRPPPSAILTAPAGIITDNTPTYSWDAVSGSSWYYLWVNDSTGNKIKQWYTASEAGCPSGGGACYITPATTLESGNSQWWIRTWNSNGSGLWSSANEFTVVP